MEKEEAKETEKKIANVEKNTEPLSFNLYLY
jgi:hypothetical protein